MEDIEGDLEGAAEPASKATDVLLAFCCKVAMIRSLSRRPSIFIHELTTVDARIDSSIRLCRSLVILSPPHEKPRSASTDDAAHKD